MVSVLGFCSEKVNDLDADIIFIKNIDNVVPDRLKADTVTYKKLIAGVLVTLQKQVFEYLTLLDSGKYTHDQMMEMLQFLQKKLFCMNPETKDLEDSVLAIYLKKRIVKSTEMFVMFSSVPSSNIDDLLYLIHSKHSFLSFTTEGTEDTEIL